MAPHPTIDDLLASELLPLLLETMQTGVTLRTLTGGFLVFNRAMERLSGYSFEEASQIPHLQLQPLGTNRRWPLLCKDGSVRDTLVDARVVSLPGGARGVLGLVSDITDTLETARELDVTRARMERALSSMRVILWETDRDLEYRWLHSGQLAVEPLMGKTDYDIFPPDVARELMRFKTRLAHSEGPSETRITVPNRAGKPTHWRVTGEAVRATSGDVLGLTGVASDETRQVELQRALTTLVTEERQSVGRELHDGVAQELHGIQMLAAALRRRLTNIGSKDAKAVNSVVELITSAQQHLRAIINGVRPLDVEEEELQDALYTLAQTTRRHHGIDCELHGTVTTRLTQTEATELFYIAREAVSNAVKHSGCANICLVLGESDGRPTMRVQDNGRWAEPGEAHDALDSSTGMGRSIMMHRAELINAELTIQQRTGSGTEVVCTLRRATSRGR